MNDLLVRAEGLRSGRTPFVVATVVRVERPTSAKPGDRALVLPDGTIEGFVGGVCAESTVRLQALRLLETGESTLLRISADDLAEPASPGEGVTAVGNPCLSGGTLEIFLEAVLPPMLVHVFGESPVARALASLGTALGCEVRLTGDPGSAVLPDTTAVVVASHGRHEEEVLTVALGAGVPYVGLVASPRRGGAVLAGLSVDETARALVRTPAGLDIGARTAPEIALSVLAEVIALRPRIARPPALPASAATAAAATAATMAATMATTTVDPVCGMSVAISPASPQLDYAESVWYFCGPGCRQAFADNPARYIEGHAAP
jgi:xanthine dehydrogenase accessory factor